MQAFFMSNYIKIDIYGISDEEQNILIAQLSDFGFYAFEQDENCLSAYIKEQDFKPENLISFLPVNKKFDKTVIEEENWNSKWESSFQPVLIDDFALIRAAFHEPADNVKHDLVITPKMSFGTGHHATTYLMVQLMKTIDFENKSVLDFGTGTGVLAILAEKSGASKVTAVDYDEWSINNAIENLEANKSKKISLEKRSDLKGMASVEIVLANINLNVITEAAESISTLLDTDGLLLTSGFLVRDEGAIESLFSGKQFVKKCVLNKDGWLSVLFQKL
jgi:ribosomal protein L11 methyltransferase